jgi:hypothetical protein
MVCVRDRVWGCVSATRGDRIPPHGLQEMGCGADRAGEVKLEARVTLCPSFLPLSVLLLEGTSKYLFPGGRR